MRPGKYPLHLHIGALFLVLITVFGLLMAAVGYFSLQQQLQRSAEDSISRISELTVSELNQVAAPVSLTVSMLSHSRVARATSLEERLEFLREFSEALERAHSMSTIFIGYESGDFFLVRKLATPQQQLRFNSPAGARYLVQSIETAGAGRTGHYVFLDATLRELERERRPAYASGYDVTARDWFRQGTTSSGLVITPPYLFFASGNVGMSFAQRTQGGEGVVGADITLAALGDRLDPRLISPSSELAISNASGNVVAYRDASRMLGQGSELDGPQNLRLKTLSELGVPAFEPLQVLLRENLSLNRETLTHTLDGDEWLVSISRVQIQDATPLYLAIAIPEAELFADAISLRNRSVLLTLLLILIAIPLAFLFARKIAGSMHALVLEAESISRFDFLSPVEVKSSITEVHELAVTMDKMKSTILRFMVVSQMVAAEERFEVLLPMLLDETMSAAEVSSGILFLADEGQLTPAASRLDGNTHDHTSLPTIDLTQADGLLARALTEGRACHGAIDTQPDWLPANWLRSDQFLIVQPLQNRRRELVGLLMLVRNEAIDDAQLAFVGALTSSASSSLETRELIAEQKALFEAFIKMVASAIDAKSPYTGAHCERVPELTKMLARAASEATEGPFAEFSLNDDEWEALHVAAWLHDCGKVTTPEYVVDKATKLETIYDRIHEVRMRFEVMKAEARIHCLERILAGDEREHAERDLAAELSSLDDDFLFIAQCNEGGEFMGAEKIERLQRIARRTWTCTLSDRAGVSQEELARKSANPEAALPRQEPALADRPDHVIPRKPGDTMPEDNPWGFSMAVPEALYHRGELHNLTIKRGTLTGEDRYKINEHIVQTIIMLSSVPFPKHLREVPEIAGGHHEKMDGTGYPKGLRREDMTPTARIMAIADIFEALTAIDRPYKKGKLLSEALGIMQHMCADQHIDPNLFSLFLNSGVWEEYARRYLQPQQIDEIDVEKFLPGDAHEQARI